MKSENIPEMKTFSMVFMGNENTYKHTHRGPGKTHAQKRTAKKLNFRNLLIIDIPQNGYSLPRIEKVANLCIFQVSSIPTNIRKQMKKPGNIVH